MVKCCSTLVLLAVLTAQAAAATATSATALDEGFHHLYNRDYVAAQKRFAFFQQQNGDNPLGPVSEAAGLLFSELDRLGLLESRFFTKDSEFDRRPKLQPDPQLRHRFDAALAQAQTLAGTRLARDGDDRDALFAVTLATGLRADYTALIEKRDLASLRLSREATTWAEQLLAVCPDCYDAYVATGITRYLIGTVAAPVRWMLRLAGYEGNKKQGIADLQLAATRGRYLAPYARILLSIAYVREGEVAQARELLADLRDQFPGNPLFAQELARLDRKR